MKLKDVQIGVPYRVIAYDDVKEVVFDSKTQYRVRQRDDVMIVGAVLSNWNQWYVVDDSSRGRYLKSRCGRMIALNLILSSVADYEALRASLKGN